jgi:hypothetical protein
VSPAPLAALPRPIGKALGLGVRDWRDLGRAQWAIVRWSLARRLRPRGRLVEHGLSGESEGMPPAAGSDPEEMVRAEALSLSLDRAARLGILRPKCLVRSLALADLLRGEGLDGGRIRFGVRKRNGVFQAHAWVEFRGRILADDPDHVASYSLVPELSHLPDLP